MPRFIQDKTKVGQIIMEGLQKKKKTMLQFSKDTGISYSYITKLIDGNIKNPSVKYVVILSKALDIPVEKLINAIMKNDK